MDKFGRAHSRGQSIRFLIYLVLLLVLIVIDAQFAHASNKINPTNRTIELHSSFLLNNRNLGTVSISISPEDALSLDAEGVMTLISDILTDDSLSELNAAAVEGKLTEQSFAKAGITLGFDLGSLSTTLAVPKELIKEQVISFARETASRKLAKPANFSGYLNILASASDSSQEDSETRSRSRSENFNFEGAIRVLKPVLEFEARYDRPNNGENVFFREGTRILYDIPSQASQLAIGDVFSRGTRFQDTVDLLGVALLRDYNEIRTRNVRPTTGRRFTLQRQSEVDVIVDGALVRRLSLPPGDFDIRDIPLTRGSNNIELIIRDDSGEVETIRIGVSTDTDLLDTGVAEYRLDVGVLAEQGAEGPEYDEDLPLLSSFFRYGVSPSLTAGLNLQAGESVQQLGINLLKALPYGTFEIDASGSKNDVLGDGYALFFGLDAFFGQNDALSRTLTFTAERESGRFSGLNDLGRTNTSTSLELTDRDNINLAYSQFLYKQIRGSLGLSASLDDNNEQYSLTAGLSGPLLGRRLSWSLRFVTDKSSNENEDTSGFLSLTWNLNRYARAVFDYDNTSNTFRSEYTYRRAQQRTGGFSAFIGSETGDNDDATFEAGIDYTGNRFRASIDNDTRFTDLDSDERSRLTAVNFNTAIAFAGSDIAIGRPVRDSFAIIKRHKSLAKNKVRIDNRDDGALTKSDGLGNVLVGELNAYSPRTITYDVDNLPLGYDLGEGLFALNPQFGEGYSLQIGSDATITVIGTLIDGQSGLPFSLIAGEATPVNEPDAEPVQFFCNRSGRFAISGLRPIKYELRLITEPPRVATIELEEGSNLARIGEVIFE